MNRLFIPTIGTQLLLTEDWTCSIQGEHRNHKVRQVMAGEAPTSYWGDNWRTNWERDGSKADLTLPAGTVLAVDRIYIRKGIGDFDSITFTIEDCPLPQYRSKKMKGTFAGKARFWVKLADANGMGFIIAAPEEK